MDELRKTGRVTIPTDLDVVPETLEILKKWGADAIRDCDGTDFPQQLKDADAKIYSTYYTTRKDNAWAKANPDEVQQCYAHQHDAKPCQLSGHFPAGHHQHQCQHKQHQHQDHAQGGMVFPVCFHRLSP